MEFAKVSLPNLKPIIFISGFSSVLSMLLASYGDFQKVGIYHRKTGMNMPSDEYVITKEYSKINPDTTGFTKIASINRSYTYQKILYSLAGIIAGCACLILAGEEDRLKPIKDYKEVKDTEYMKMKVDMDLAVKQKIESEKVKITSVDIMEDLLANPTYRKLKKQQIRTEEGDSEDDEHAPKEDSSWNPFDDISVQNNDKKLSEKAQKILKWLQRKQPDFDHISVEMCRASGCVKDAKTADIQGYYKEIVEAKIGEMNEKGDIRLL